MARVKALREIPTDLRAFDGFLGVMGVAKAE
jgi:hypothetical protein